MTNSVPVRRGPGRRRSEASRLAVLRATRDLLDEGGYERLTIGGIATRAGVGKDTIYRWWPSKAMIVANSVLEAEDDPFFSDEPADTGHLAADLTAWLRRRAIDYIVDPTSAARIRAVTAAATEDEKTAILIYERFAHPQQQAVVNRLRRAAEVGEIHTNADFAAVADALLGTLFYWLIARRRDVEIDTVCRLLDVLLAGLRTVE